MKVERLTKGKWTGRWAVVGSTGGIVELHDDYAGALHALRHILGIS